MREETTDTEYNLFIFLLFEFFPTRDYGMIDINRIWEITEDQSWW